MQVRIQARLIEPLKTLAGRNARSATREANLAIETALIKAGLLGKETVGKKGGNRRG